MNNPAEQEASLSPEDMGNVNVSAHLTVIWQHQTSSYELKTTNKRI